MDERRATSTSREQEGASQEQAGGLVRKNVGVSQEQEGASRE